MDKNNTSIKDLSKRIEDINYWIKRFDKQINGIKSDINLLMKSIVKFKKENERLDGLRKINKCKSDEHKFVVADTDEFYVYMACEKCGKLISKNKNNDY